MQYVPFNLAQELWNATPERNWSALRERVKERQEKKGDFEGVHPTTLLQVINQLAHFMADLSALAACSDIRNILFICIITPTVD